jgi:NAD(P)H-flavin reductase
LTTHPVTICSLSTSRELVFYVRPAKGITARLKQLAEKGTGVSIPVGIEGPYGTSTVADAVAKYDKTLLVAEGSGAGFVFPLLQSLLEAGNKAGEIQVVLAVRHYAPVSWFVVVSPQLLGVFLLLLAASEGKCLKIFQTLLDVSQAS